MLFLLLTASPARAGHYEVSYAGGSWSHTGSGAQNYFLSQQGNWGGGGYQQITGSMGTIAGNASGTITATFTWNNGGNGAQPPSSVVVRELCEAHWGVGGTNYTNVGGSRSHGLSADFVEITNCTNTATGGLIAATGHRVVVNPGSSFQVTANPSADASCSLQPFFAVASAGIGVSYSAAVVEGTLTMVSEEIPTRVDPLHASKLRYDGSHWMSLSAVPRAGGELLPDGVTVVFEELGGNDLLVFDPENGETATINGQALVKVRGNGTEDDVIVYARWKSGGVTVAEEALLMSLQSSACTTDLVAANAWNLLPSPCAITWTTRDRTSSGNSIFHANIVAAISQWEVGGHVVFTGNSPPVNIVYQDIRNPLEEWYGFATVENQDHSQRLVKLNTYYLDGGPRQSYEPSDFPPMSYSHLVGWTAAHETGHMLNLDDHASDHGNLMFFANGRFLCGVESPTADDLASVAAIYSDGCP
jgi:hypothetical protein